uniref:Zinc metalloproteinase n=1 Tax=Strongyloides stercoralis TaxID=6248 RepID=A0A0K0E406_STRER
MNLIITIFLLSFFICIILGDNTNKKRSDLESIVERVKKSVTKDPILKWSFPIDYDIKEGLNEDTITEALETLERETCLRFRRTDKFTNGGLIFKHGDQCISFIGKVSDTDPQEIELSDECDIVTVAIHETSHALGVIHEMARHDRDNYINVLYQNMDQGNRYNFDKSTLDEAIPHKTKYDYGSIMHYDRLAASSNGGVVMAPKLNGYLKTIGQTTEYGFNDAKRLNMHYCFNVCPKKLKCENGGYTDPNNCKVCKCPRMFGGTLCKLLKSSDKGCGIGKRIASRDNKFIITKGKKSCYYEIKAPIGHKIKLTINNLKVADSFVCQPGSGLEIKYLADKTVSGAMLCGRHSAKNFISKNNIIVMRYVGKTINDNLSIRFNSFK